MKKVLTSLMFLSGISVLNSADKNLESFSDKELNVLTFPLEEEEAGYYRNMPVDQFVGTRALPIDVTRVLFKKDSRFMRGEIVLVPFMEKDLVGDPAKGKVELIKVYRWAIVLGEIDGNYRLQTRSGYHGKDLLLNLQAGEIGKFGKHGTQTSTQVEPYSWYRGG